MSAWQAAAQVALGGGEQGLATRAVGRVAAVHSSAAGAWTRAAPAFFAGSSWQPTHRARPSAFSRFGRSARCPLWQLVHSEAAACGWLPARAFPTSSWHPTHSVDWAPTSTGAKSLVCGSWQVRHSPSAAGGCRLPLPASGFSWQVRHTPAPAAGAVVRAACSWQVPHSRAGCTEARSRWSLAAEWGGWQDAHFAPATEKPPWPAANPFAPSWQEAQRASLGWARRAASAAPCGRWQVRQLPPTGAWTTRPREAAALVAARAELALGALQDLRVVGAVGVVAAGALVDLRVAVGLLEAERRGLVAAEAQLRLLGLQPQRAHEAVGLVARRAVPLGHGGVRDLARLAHVGVALDAGAALLEARPLLQLAVGDARAQAESGERRRQADPRWSPHDRSHGSPRSPALSYGSGLGGAPWDGAAAAAGEATIRSAATRSS